jgi:hypothetical protein
MLTSRPQQVIARAIKTRKTLHFSWPISLSSSDLPMIPVVTGTLLGVYLLLHGCILLQRRAGNSTTKTPVLTQMVSTSKIFSTQAKEPPLSSTREIIRLTPENALPDNNSQQAKIAAALLKAGVSPPASRTAPEDQSHAMVDLADQQTVRKVGSGNVVQSLDFNASKILVKGGRTDAPHMFGEGAVAEPFHWKPAVMVWSGPILTLACLYILALHFGWL